MMHFDLALIGFGAATMSLATRLAPDYAGRIAIIEPRTLPVDDRTWCGWRLSDHPFTDVATQTWTTWAVSHGAREIIRGSHAIPYEMLRASSVQRRALDAVASRPDWRFFGDRSLRTASHHPPHWQLILSDGESLTADHVMDSRPPALTLRRPWLWQSFVGRELVGPELAGDSPVRLMDFLSDDSPLLSFLYELPIAPGHRLIELTRFAPEQPPLDELAKQLDGQLAARGLTACRVVREESGHLPMAPIAPSDQTAWMRVGTAGGSMRPATGYAFHEIQRWATRCAGRLMADEKPCAPARKRYMDWLDGVFLEHLWRQRRTDSTALPFIQLFEHAPAEAMARFLMSRPHLKDFVHILGALPPYPMLKAALGHAGMMRRDSE